MTFASKQLSGMVVMSWILRRHLRVTLLRAILLDQRSCISYSSVASIKNLNGTFKRSREIIDQISRTRIVMLAHLKPCEDLFTC